MGPQIVKAGGKTVKLPGIPRRFYLRYDIRKAQKLIDRENEIYLLGAKDALEKVQAGRGARLEAALMGEQT